MKQEVWEKSGGICYICGLRMGRNGEFGELLNFTMDHWRPRRKNGTNTIDNLVGAHLLCNNQKGDRWGPTAIDEKFISSCQFQIRKLMRAYPSLIS